MKLGWVVVFVLLSSVVFAQNLGFEDGMNFWETSYTSFGQDYTSINSSDYSSEGVSSVHFGGTNDQFFGIPQHSATINHTAQTVNAGDRICVDVQTDRTGTVRLFSRSAGTFFSGIVAGEKRDVCINSSGAGPLDLNIQGTLSAGCQGVCLTRFYLDNIRITSCSDGVQNQNETGIDCGGPFCSECEEESLLEKYAPVLYFHPDERFFPTTIDAMLNESDLVVNGQVVDPDPVSISSLDSSNESYYLDMINASGGFISQTPNPNRFDEYDNVVYGREIRPDDDHIVLQYWFFYPYNDFRGGHEGDWEMIQVILNQTNETPLSATYSYHYDAITYNWSEVRVDNKTHPKVYVSLGGHASYKDPRSVWRYRLPTLETVASENESTRIDSVISKIGNETWVNFLGRWGEFVDINSYFNGPQSPANLEYGEQVNRWDFPIEFANDARPPETAAVTGSPVNLHAYDKNGNHVGLNKSEEVEIEIPETYLYVPSNDSKEVIVILTKEDITFLVNGTGPGAFNLTINTYNSNTKTQKNVTYKNIPVNTSTSATINLTQTNPNFVMKIDTNGDGTVDNTTLPSETIVDGNETNPEADSDSDGFSDSIDNCPNLYNPNQITDFDNDGFDNLLCGGDDCNDDNENINPNATESCNNEDDNCNSQIDESLTRVCGLTDAGTCTFGNEICQNGNWTNCDAVFPEQESCNNLDDDCDFEIDNGFDTGNSCSVGVGECKADGYFVCSQDNQSSICNAVPGTPSNEVCDRLDNDCNGVIDNSCSINSKLEAITLLESAKTGSCTSSSWFRPCKDNVIDQIVDKIEQSLNPNYFIDNKTLNPSRTNYGLAVFQHESTATKLCNRWKKRVGIESECNDALDLMKEADKNFAEVALHDANNAPLQNAANLRCYERRIQKAQSHMNRANSITRDFLAHWAISEYGKSWRFSQEAIKFASATRDIC